MNTPQVIPIRPRMDFTLISEANHRVANHLTLLANLVQFQLCQVFLLLPVIPAPVVAAFDRGPGGIMRVLGS